MKTSFEIYLNIYWRYLIKDCIYLTLRLACFNIYHYTLSITHNAFVANVFAGDICDYSSYSSFVCSFLELWNYVPYKKDIFTFQEATGILLDESYGLEVVASALMSSFIKSRLVALEVNILFVT